MPLYLPRKVAAQPQGRARVDFANPLTKHMTFAWTASNGFQESVNGDVKDYAVNGDLVVNGVRSSKGIVQNSSVNGAIIWGIRSRSLNSPQNQFTIGVAFQVRDLSADNPDVFTITNVGFYPNKIGFVASKIQASTTVANTTVVSDTFVSVGDWIYAVYVLQNGNFQLYVNGVKQAAVGTGTLPIQSAPYSYMEINPSRANVLTAFVATRPWSQAEVTSWTNNPWQIFEPAAVTVVPQSTALPVLVRQNTAGTSQLNGSAPDPVNVPGNTWYASNPARFLRSASGGVLIPNAAFWSGLLSYNVATARQKITVSNAVLLTGTDYINLNINASTQTATVYGSGTGYCTVVKPAASVQIFEWSGSGVPTLIGTSSSALPAGPITVTSAFIEHLTSGTLNASVTVGGTTYTSTATVGSPLSGTYAGLFSNSGGSGGITASEILIESNTIAYSTRITWAEAQYQASGVPSVTDYSSPMSRGIFRGIERGVA